MKPVVGGGEVTTGTDVGATVVTVIVVVGAREVVVVLRGLEAEGPSSEVAFGVSSLAEASTLASPGR